MRHRPTGHVAHIRAGSLLLSPRAVERLADHLQSHPSSDVATMAVIRDIIRLSRAGHTSRDEFTRFMRGDGESTLTTTQAAHRLGITPGAVRKRISRGALPAEFDGAVWRIDPVHLGEKL